MLRLPVGLHTRRLDAPPVVEGAVTRLYPGATEPGDSVEPLIVMKTDRGWRLEDRTRASEPMPVLGDLLLILEKRLLDSIRPNHLDLLGIHAAGWVRDQLGIIFWGGSGQGKTTTVGSLLQAGDRYLSDELVGLQPESRTAVGFPFPLGAARKTHFSSPVVRHSLIHDRAGSPYTYGKPQPSKVDCPRKIKPDRWLLIELDRQQSASPSLEDQPTSEAMTRLLPHVLVPEDQDCRFRRLARFLRGDVRCQRLRFEQIDRARGLLERLLEG